MDSVSQKLENVKLNGDGSSKLSFGGKSYKLDTEEDAKPIVDEMTQNSSGINILELSGNTIGIPAAEAIGKALEKYTSLETCLWSDMFTGRMKTEIAPALEHLSNGIKLAHAHLVEIDLSDNAFGPNGIVGITGLLAHEACFSLKILRLNNNGLGHQGCRYLVDALKRGLSASESAGKPMRLTTFTAGRNRLENVGAQLLSEVFKEMGSLEELSLIQNGIGIHGPQGVEDLVDALHSNTGLRILNLSDNSIKPSGAKLLSTVLPSLPKLEVLNLSDCLLRPSGCQVLAEVLADESTVPELTTLNVSGNEINSSSAIELALSMAKKKKLSALDLNCNELGEEGVSNLHEALKSVDKEDVLGSLSDDEGSASEEEEDEEDHVDSEEEEEGGMDDEEAAASAKVFDTNTLFSGGGSRDSPASDQADTKDLFGSVTLQENPFTKPNAVKFNFKDGSSESCVDNHKQFTGLFTSISGTGTPSKSGLFSSFTSATTPAADKPTIIQLTLEEVIKDFENGDPENLKKVFVDVLKKFEKSSCWSAIAVNAGSEQLNGIIKKAVDHSDIKQKLIHEFEATTRLAYKLCYLEDSSSDPDSSSSKTLLKFMLKNEPNLAGNSILVELGLIKSEDKQYKPQSISDSTSFSKALRFTRSVLSDKSLNLPADVANTLLTLLKNQPDSILEKNQIWSKLSPNKAAPTSGKGESNTSDSEFTDDFEALLNTIESQVGGLSLTVNSNSGDKHAN